MIPLKEWTLKRPGTLFPVFFLSLYHLVNAQNLPPGTESAGLAGCYTTLRGPTAVAGNQAGLGWKEEMNFHAEFTMPFMVKEMGVAGLSFSAPLSHGNFATRLTSGGIPGYRDQSLWISYGIKTGEKVAAGAGLFYNLISVRNEPNHQFKISFAGGVQVKVNDRLLIGGHLLYPLQYNSSESPYGQLATAISLGGSYEFFDSNLVYLEYRFYEMGKPALMAGIESTIGDQVSIRGGFRTNPSSFSLGTGFSVQRFRIMFASQLIYNYGLTSSIGITYAL